MMARNPQKDTKNPRIPVDKSWKPPPYVPPGRPTKYKPEYCEMLYDHLAKGYSYETFGVTIGVTKSTLYEWEKVHKDFSDAKKVGIGANQLYWEAQGRSGMRSKTFHSGVWIYNMKNRFRSTETWKPVKEEEATNNFNFTLNYDPTKIEAIDNGESN